MLWKVKRWLTVCVKFSKLSPERGEFTIITPLFGIDIYHYAPHPTRYALWSGMWVGFWPAPYAKFMEGGTLYRWDKDWLMRCVPVPRGLNAAVSEWRELIS